MVYMSQWWSTRLFLVEEKSNGGQVHLVMQYSFLKELLKTSYSQLQWANHNSVLHVFRTGIRYYDSDSDLILKTGTPLCGGTTWY